MPHHYYTITERTDDPRLEAFAQFCQKNRAASAAVFTRPDHVQADPVRLTVIQQAINSALQQATSAAANRQYATAQQWDDEAKRKQEELRQAHAQAAQWIDTALQPVATENKGYAIVSYAAWPANHPWTVHNFLKEVEKLDINGHQGRRFAIPLARRIFVPLAVFDTAATETPAAPAAQQPATHDATDTPAEPGNRPPTAPVRPITHYMTPEQKALLETFGENDTLKRAFVYSMGWDLPPEEAAPRQPSKVKVMLNVSQATVGHYRKMIQTQLWEKHQWDFEANWNAAVALAAQAKKSEEADEGGEGEAA
jgi:hypothetical protein